MNEWNRKPVFFWKGLLKIDARPLSGHTYVEPNESDRFLPLFKFNLAKSHHHGDPWTVFISYWKRPPGMKLVGSFINMTIVLLFLERYFLIMGLFT